MKHTKEMEQETDRLCAEVLKERKNLDRENPTMEIQTYYRCPTHFPTIMNHAD